MFWTTGLLLALAISQVPADLVTPKYVEDVKEASSQRIVSGWQAEPGQIPYQTSLRLVNAVGGVSGCGGSVVSREWVISAAHCTAGQITAVVRAGLVSLTTPEYISESTELYNHPTFNVNTPLVVQPNDISIIKLDKPVTYSVNLQAIRLQTTDEAHRNYNNEIVVASGFGRTWTGGAQSEVLNWVYLRALANVDCQPIYGAHLINANAICAQYFNITSQSTCQGDSGGPLVHTGSDNVPVLVGIASFVAGGDFGCHSGLPAGFIRTGPFLPWLEQVTGVDFENLNEEDPTTVAPTTEEPTTTEQPTTIELPSTTELPTTIELPSTTELPTTIELPSTTELPITTTTELPSTNATTPLPPTTKPPRPPTTPEPEEESEEEEDSSSSSEEDDEELSQLLKKLIVKVKVKVNVNNQLKKKVKVKSHHKIKA